MRDSDGEINKAVKISPELGDVIERNLEDFKETFGRKPRAHDRLLFQTYSISEKDMTRQTLSAMKSAEIRPILAYVYRKTGWIISDLKLLTPLERKEYDEVCDEFEAAVEAGMDPKELGYPETVEQSLLDHLYKNHIVGGYFIENHFNKYRRISKERDDVETISASCMINFVRCLKSVHALLSEDLSYDSYNLLRSMYENYLTMKYVYSYPEQSASLLAQLGVQLGTHEYALNRAGDPITSKILRLEDGIPTNIPTRWQMASSLGNIDVEMYKEIYHSFSSLSHSDLGNIAYFLQDGKFDYHNQGFTVDALIKSHLLCLLMFSCLKQNSSCRKYLLKDLDFLCHRVFFALLVCVRYLEEVEDQSLPKIGWSIIGNIVDREPKLRKIFESIRQPVQ